MAGPARLRCIYEFGSFRLDALNRVLLRGGEVLPLGTTVIETLRVLVENHGEVVTKEELLRTVWPGAIVEENNLTHNISVLRKSFGEGPGEQRYIQTIPKRGYRFVATVTEIHSPAEKIPASLRVVPPIAIRRTPSIALLLLGVAALAAAVAISYFWVRPRGSAVFTQLTDQPGEELYPALSPDGNSFVYASRASGHWDIYSQRVGGRTAVNLTENSGFDNTQPVFSPDGARIAFRSERAGGGIYTMGASGESVRRMTDFGYNPAWSPDGKEIVCATVTFQRPDYRPFLGSKLFVVNVLTGEKHAIAEQADDAVQPQWSPRGFRIAYWACTGGQRDIWTVSAKGGKPVSVTEDGPLDWDPVWSPDGKYLYFSSDRGGSMNVWRARIDEESGKLAGGMEPITTPSPYSGYLSFSRDGRRMTYVQQVRTNNVHKIQFDPDKESTLGPAVPLTQGLKLLFSPRPSYDGSWLTFVSGGARKDVFVMRTDGTGLQQLTDDPYDHREASWSPDGKQIAFGSNRSGKYEMWLINADGGALRQISRMPHEQAVSPIWSPDGRRLAGSVLGGTAFIIEAGKRWQEQSPERLPPWIEPDLYFAPRSWSPDGEKLAGDLRQVQDLSSGIVVYSLRSRMYRRLTNVGSWPVWLSDSRRLLFLNNDEILLIDSQSGRVRKVFSYARYDTGQAFGLSRDDRWIYFTVAVKEADVWLMSQQ